MNTYHFIQIDESNSLYGTSKLMISSSVEERIFGNTGKFGEYMAGFRGALLKLFGEPIQKLSDATYDYIIEATDDIGNRWILTAYEGPSGPAIGGNSRDQSIYPVAIALLDLIVTTVPADFEETHWNPEYGTTTTYGCLGGSCYYYEERGKVSRATTDLAELQRQENDERIKRLLEVNPNACLSCEATGKCEVCKGIGVIEQYGGFDNDGNPILLPPPYPECPECDGDGICNACNGTGKSQRSTLAS